MHDDDDLLDEEVLIVTLLKAAMPDVTFTTTPTSLSAKKLPYAVIQSSELDDAVDALGQRWLFEITSSHETREQSKRLAMDIFSLMGKFHRETAGSTELGYINEVTRFKPQRYSTTAESSVGREHLYHYHARYDIEVAS
ncbi:hypothetical protein SAMN04489743_2845 [Pseudarthrobacter equi]|uniref:Uncharacterized protein n=1 Tax=Pseudarthrobacter equi TaxID=728066 RepID=A0A1H2A8R1_9MICC|nr:hypothetical protein [Pseudarthrobacter equi]SDT42244.1 hypothetical protein SAMN04489743_2845 [Pseudarthrobacter equi]